MRRRNTFGGRVKCCILVSPLLMYMIYVLMIRNQVSITCTSIPSAKCRLREQEHRLVRVLLLGNGGHNCVELF